MEPMCVVLQFCVNVRDRKGGGGESSGRVAWQGQILGSTREIGTGKLFPVVIPEKKKKRQIPRGKVHLAREGETDVKVLSSAAAAAANRCR